MHFCPVGDPEFLGEFLLGLKGLVKRVALLSANLHTVVLWHHPVVNSPLEETALLKKTKINKKYCKSLKLSAVLGCARVQLYIMMSTYRKKGSYSTKPN